MQQLSIQHCLRLHDFTSLHPATDWYLPCFGFCPTGTGEDERLADFTPSFLWLLRDFYLKLEEEEGRKVGMSPPISCCTCHPLTCERLHVHGRACRHFVLLNMPCIDLLSPWRSRQESILPYMPPSDILSPGCLRQGNTPVCLACCLVVFSFMVHRADLVAAGAAAWTGTPV